MWLDRPCRPKGGLAKDKPKATAWKGRGAVITGVPLALGSGYEVGRVLARGYGRQRLLLVHREGLMKWGALGDGDRTPGCAP